MKEGFEKLLNTGLLVAILLVLTLGNNPQAMDVIKLTIKAQDELNKTTTVQVTVNDSVKVDTIKVNTLAIDTVKTDTTVKQ